MWCVSVCVSECMCVCVGGGGAGRVMYIVELPFDILYQRLQLI